MPRPMTTEERQAYLALTAEEKSAYHKVQSDMRVATLKSMILDYPVKEDFVTYLMAAYPADFERQESEFFYDLMKDALDFAHDEAGVTVDTLERTQEDLANANTDIDAYKVRIASRDSYIVDMEALLNVNNIPLPPR